MDELRESIRQKFHNGYFGYNITITFKPQSCYALLHPKKAHKKFTEHFTKYVAKHKFQIIMYPELSHNGLFHYHGFLFDKESDFSRHEKKIRLLRNYVNRNYGVNMFQRIFKYHEDFKSDRTGFRGNTLWTSFDKMWQYTTKDQDKYGFLKRFQSNGI